jgi:hypothetical protein
VIDELASGMAGHGLRFSADLAGSYFVAESVTITSGTEAVAVYCAHDGLIVLGPDGPDGMPTVVNDQVENFRYEYHLFLEDGKWRVGEQQQLEQLSEGTACPPAS